MLLRFVVENLFCFAGETLFSMVATKDDAHSNHKVKTGRVDALRISALYGANAHGKTRLIRAMALAKRFITEGFKPGQSIPVKPFLLDSHCRQKPSRFEFTFMVQDVEYAYGFVCDTKRFHEEWLFSRPNKREVMLFRRDTNAEGVSEFDIGRTLARGRIEDSSFLGFLIKGVRANELFLTHAVVNNFTGLMPVFHWFQKSLIILETNNFSVNLPRLVDGNQDLRNFIGKFLKIADTGIVEITTKNEKTKFDDLADEVRRQIQKFIGSKAKERGQGMHIVINEETDLPIEDMLVEKITLLAQHNTAEGDVVHFPLEDESAGTNRLLELLPLLYNRSGSENVYIIDELDRTLHPSLSRLFIDTFLNLSPDNKNQLIFTTHESNLLDLDLLRRDEIWFVEKDTDGKSHLYPLSSMKIRPDVNIKRGYLHGRFGAIPFIGNTTALGWNRKEETHEIGKDFQDE